MRAAIYTRVSTDDQAREGYSLDEQERRCRAEADAEGWEAELFPEEGVSGRLASRPQLDLFLARLDEFDVLIVYSLDRLGRSVHNLLELYDRVENSGVRIIFIRERIDTSTAVGRLLRTVLSAIAEFEREMIIDRTKGGIAARARGGKPSGGPRTYGFEWDDGSFVPIDAEVKVANRIYDEYLAGRSQGAIANALNQDGVRSLKGGKWIQVTVRKVLTNPVYVGRIRHDGEEYDGEHEAVVPVEKFERVQEMLAETMESRNRGGGRAPKGRHVCTRGTLRCQLCGEAMSPRTRQNRNGTVTEWYLCVGHRRGLCPQLPVRREPIDESLLNELETRWLDLEATRDRFRARRIAEVAMASEALAAARSEALRAADTLMRVERDYLDGRITAEEWHDLKAKLLPQSEAAEAEVRRIEERIANLRDDDATDEAIERLMMIRAAVLGKLDEAPDLPALRKLIRAVFRKIVYVESPEGPVLWFYPTFDSTGIADDGEWEPIRQVLELEGATSESATLVSN